MSPARIYPVMDASATSMEQPKATKPSQKRKRDSPDYNGHGRLKNAHAHPKNGGHEESLNELLLGEAQELNNFNQQMNRGATHPDEAHPSTAAAALAASMPHMTIPRPTDMSFNSTNTANDEEHAEPSFDMGVSEAAHSEGAPYNLDAYSSNGLRNVATSPGGKPAVGTEEWHKVRKDNHKEVERRRRETINEGINELAKIVPNCDKQKGAVLSRTVSYISQLKENEKNTIEKWTLEKILMDQAVADISSSNDKLKTELDRAWNEAMKWKKRCIDAGLADKDDDVRPGSEEEVS